MAGAAQALKSPTDQRAFERRPLDRAGVLRVGDQNIPIRIADLTRDGCRIDAEIELNPGARVTIGLAGVGQVSARLVWRSEHGYGCAFDRSLQPGAVTAAFSPSNLARFPNRSEPPRTEPGTLKLSARARLGVAIGSIVVSWMLVAIGVAGLLTSGAFGR